MIQYLSDHLSLSDRLHFDSHSELKRNKHPFLRGIYANGNEKVIGTKNLDVTEIHNYALDLRNQIGRKNSSAGYNRPVFSQRPSIQGEWHERMDLIGLEMKIEHKNL